jgi:iron complex transport system substrate-binding protein
MKKILALLLALAMVLSMVACGAKAPEVMPEATPEATPAAPEVTEAVKETEAAGPRVIVDALGREVEIPAEVNRIVAMGNAPRLCSYLQLADKFVTTNQGDLSETVFMAFGWAYRDNWLDLPIAGAGGYGNFNAEAILEADPDVIVCTYEADIVANLEEQTGLPVVSVAQGVLYAEDYDQSLRILGEVCGASERAEEVIDFVNACLEDLNNRTKDVADEDKPLILGSAATFRGGHGIQGVYVDHPVFSAINAKDAAIGLEKQYFDTGVEVDLEKILEWNPEVLFLDAGNLGLVEAEYAENPQFFQQLAAVQNGQVYQWPNSTSSSANLEISLVNTYYAGMVLYPDAFADMDFEAKAEEIFEFFLGRTGYLEVLTENGVGYGNITLGE